MAERSSFGSGRASLGVGAWGTGCGVCRLCADPVPDRSESPSDRPSAPDVPPWAPASEAPAEARAAASDAPVDPAASPADRPCPARGARRDRRGPAAGRRRRDPCPWPERRASPELPAPRAASGAPRPAPWPDRDPGGPTARRQDARAGQARPRARVPGSALHRQNARRGRVRAIGLEALSAKRRRVVAWRARRHDGARFHGVGRPLRPAGARGHAGRDRPRFQPAAHGRELPHVVPYSRRTGRTCPWPKRSWGTPTTAFVTFTFLYTLMLVTLTVVCWWTTTLFTTRGPPQPPQYGRPTKPGRPRPRDDRLAPGERRPRERPADAHPDRTAEEHDQGRRVDGTHHDRARRPRPVAADVDPAPVVIPGPSPTARRRARSHP